jgi:aromatic ring-opening dioxygenase catalytic subunit (LigB family)
MLTSRVFLVPHLVTLLLDEHRGHSTEMLGALAEAGAAFRAEGPEIIVALSARWEVEGPFLVGAAPRHRTITDYSGFGVEVRYDCPGHPALARALVEAGLRAGLRVATTDHGVDSGVSVPLHFLHPSGNVPVVPLSLAPFEAAECRRWGGVIRRVVASRAERVAFVVGGMLSNDEHAWSLKRDVPEAGEFDAATLELLKTGRWSELPPGDGARAVRAKPQANLRHLEVLRGFLGADVSGTVRCYESAPGVGAALVEFDLPDAASVAGPAPGP